MVVRSKIQSLTYYSRQRTVGNAKNARLEYELLFNEAAGLNPQPF
jgi:hypothetical protein